MSISNFEVLILNLNKLWRHIKNYQWVFFLLLKISYINILKFGPWWGLICAVLGPCFPRLTLECTIFFLEKSMLTVLSALNSTTLWHCNIIVYNNIWRSILSKKSYMINDILINNKNRNGKKKPREKPAFTVSVLDVKPSISAFCCLLNK